MTKSHQPHLWACLFSCSLIACAQAPAPTPVSVRIATFNAHNLFDEQRDGDEPVTDPADYAARLLDIERVLDLLDGDVVVLQEVENARVLQSLASALGFAQAVLVPGNDPRGINSGVLSRLGFDSVLSHKSDLFPGPTGPYRYARDCLELHCTVQSRHLVLLAVHLKSKSVPDDPDRRLAEARHTRAIADSITADDPSSAVLILGDMNDVPGSPPFVAIEGTAPQRYADSASVVPAAWTYSYEGTPVLIDHQMANPVLYSTLDRSSVLIPHGAVVQRASDHAPIAATYAFR